MPGKTVHKYNAEQVREKALEILKSAPPEGLQGPELQTLIYGDTNDVDTHRRRSQHLGFALKHLRQSKRIRKVGNQMTGRWVIISDRPAPEVHDLPANGKRTYTKRGSTNGAANGDVRSYIIRDIKAKLAELEALG